MLSILIPCYNYSSYSLVKSLYEQCKDLDIYFEILVSEDAGDRHIKDNKNINNFENCKYIVNEKNLGRSGNINRLLKWSKYNLKLVLDCDVTPKYSNYINNYIELAKNHHSFVCFGGIDYNENLSHKNNLRYNYGTNREAKDASSRKKSPYKYLLTSNLIIKNCDQLFDENIQTYGYEDLVFANEIRKKNINVLHIDNPLYHNNLEENKVYLNKIQQSLLTLINLEKKGILSNGMTGISKLYHFINKYYLGFILSFLYFVLDQKIQSQLKRKGRPVWLLDMYKLIYFNKNY